MQDTVPIRRSVEVEYWVIDEEGRLVSPGELLDAADGVEQEFVKPLLEVKTTPCVTTEALREELFDRLQAVLRRADELGRGLVPLATPINASEIEERASERTRVQNKAVGDSFAYVRHCAGTHIHIEQVPNRAIDQLNTFIALDPALALVNSSPYFRGQRLVPGARSKLYRWMAYDGLPSQGRLWSYVTDRSDWQSRLTRCYEEFTTRARSAGIDQAAIEEHFDPESAIWTPVQLRETFGTVEWRSPDTALPSQVLRLADRLAGLTRHLMQADVEIRGERGRLTDDTIVLPTFDALQEKTTAAIRQGPTADVVRSYLDRMGFAVSAYDPLVQDLDAEPPISTAQARQLRLEYATHLKRDLEHPLSTHDH